ncbi:MAG: MarC family protein [Deinococcota bacterium]|uniref:MarC family protein n=1 Tax=Allomeiothermus silvanus TaxID=52022 RepID=UPI002355FF32|nr:MarC family protein [Allomeiothermus silvanus]MBI5812808.1 MarC family protein [Allomeiothermus silvanus]MCL6568178.1 MarC family protein [Allomeiothermus silvanus]
MLEFSLQAFLTLLVVVDPIGLVPIFIALAGGRSHLEQRYLARKAVVVAGVVILGFAVLGKPVLEYLGITLGALRIAAGILLFKIGFDMIFAHLERETPEEYEEAQTRLDFSVFPLAIPLIAGPGTLASVLILTSEAHKAPYGLGIVLGMAGVVLLLTYLFLRAASPLSRLLRRTGINVVTRVLGILLAALAVQYVVNGIRALGF